MTDWPYRQVPKRAFLYWGRNRPFNWLRLQTVQTFLRLNPDWDVTVYYPEEPEARENWHTGEQGTAKGVCLWEELKSLCGANLVALGPEWGLPAGLSEVHRSDLLRYEVLARDGGVYMDTDIVWLRPMARLALEGGVAPKEVTAVVCRQSTHPAMPPHHHIGLLAGAPGGEFSGGVRDAARRHLERAAPVRYQELGRELLDRLRLPARGLGNLPKHAVYPVRAKELAGTLARPGWRWRRRMENSLGVHWYGGHRVWTEDIVNGTERVPLVEMAHAQEV